MRSALAANALTLRLLFTVAAVVLLGGAGWGGWRLVEQDRVLGVERQRERLEAAASVVCAALGRVLGEWEQTLRATMAEASPAAPPGAVIALFRPSAAVWRGGARPPYLPAVAVPAAMPDAAFAQAEAAEFQARDFGKAAALYRREVERGDPATRAEPES